MRFFGRPRSRSGLLAARCFCKTAACILSGAMLLIFGCCAFYSNALPDSYLVTRGEDFSLGSRVEISAVCDSAALEASVSDNTRQATLSLWGVVPIKEVTLCEVERPVLIAGGNPFGIKLHTKGVMVVDFEDIVCGDKKKCPAKECGIKEGDVIISVNDIDVNTSGALAKVISKSEGKALEIEIMRDNEPLTFFTNAVFCTDDDTFKTGMYTRDSSAGVGTITFFDPVTSSFGGLGHAVCDSTTKELLPLLSGEVADVTINSFTRAQKGKPGELCGSFVSGKTAGIIEKNTPCGVFGKLQFAPNLSAPLMLGYKQEAQVGKAMMLTTISGSTPKEYEIEIEKIDYSSDGVKNMIIRVCDPELLMQTGGILQGMSGSPIIQNGKLIGAVTHVFVNDATRGYAVFAQKMYETMHTGS